MTTPALPYGRTINARLLAVAAILLAATFAAFTATAAKAASYANFSRVTYNYGTRLSTSQEANRYQVMVMQSTNAAMVPALKAANPNLKILMYMDPLDSKTDDLNAQAVCTSYTTDASSHPNWFLYDQSGNPIHYQGVSSKYVMDIGNSGYEQACLARSTSLAKQDGFDGIFFDDIDASSSYAFPRGTTTPTYSTTSAWQNANLSLLTYGGSTAHSNGLLLVANIAAATPTLWQQWNTPIDGAMEESWTDGGVGTAQQIPFWANKVANAAWSEAHGKYAILHSYSTTETGNNFGMASQLLVSNGHSTYTSSSCYSSCEAWYPEYTNAQNLGAPTGAYTMLSNGAYERWFQNGVVVVDPTSRTLGPISLGGDTYSGTGYTSVSTVTLAPTTAAILIADSATPPPTTSAPVNSGLPTISGSAVQGQTLTASTGTWSGNPAPTYSYQWSSCSSTGCAAIPGATAITYTVQSADVGATLEAVVTASNGASASATSAPTTPVPTPAFTLSGTATRARVRHGATAVYTINVNRTAGYTGSVSLTASGVPAGAAATFSPSSTTGSTTLSVATGRVAAGTYSIIVTGSGGGKTAAVTSTLQITRG